MIGWTPELDVSGAEPALRRGVPIACDAPLCRRCGIVDASRRDEFGLLLDTFDVCPAHRDEPDSRGLLTPTGAVAVRTAARLRIEREPC